MRDDDDPLRAAWQAQTVEVPRFDPAALRLLNHRFELKLRWRNRLELAAAAVVFVWFGTRAWGFEEPLMRLGSVLVMLGAVVVAVTLVRRGTPAPSALADRVLDWRRETLKQQRDLLASIWWWYLGPLIPGLVVFLAGMARHSESPGVVAVFGAFCAAVFAGIGWMNRAAARRLDQELKELDDA